MRQPHWAAQNAAELENNSALRVSRFRDRRHQEAMRHPACLCYAHANMEFCSAAL